ncbi:MAG TPA: TOBE-like domain-containing protein, partial [Ilumatobacteraceae bacterium]|nr:TOBE-like domain-containing protein [Ilumatobacteraceae bacterium]
GQAQRVALARAVAGRPRVLLLDEPLAALDVRTRAEMRRELRRHLDSFDGMRVLVTHDSIDAFALADRVAIIDQGATVQVGTLAEVTSHPRSRYVADLVGLNLIAGEVSDGHLCTADGTVVVVADAASGPSYAVIRPHSIALTSAVPIGSSARNVWAGTVSEIDRLGGRARVRLDGQLTLTVEITLAALDELALRPGDEVFAAAKATDIEVYPA